MTTAILNFAVTPVKAWGLGVLTYASYMAAIMSGFKDGGKLSFQLVVNDIGRLFIDALITGKYITKKTLKSLFSRIKLIKI